MVKVAIDKKRMRVYVDECFQKNQQSTSDLINIVGEYASKDDLIAADYAGKRSINDLYEAGFNVNECIKDKIVERIKNIKAYEIIVTPRSNTLKKELKLWSWHDKRSETPIDKYNHSIDAMFYAFNELNQESEFIMM